MPQNDCHQNNNKKPKFYTKMASTRQPVVWCSDPNSTNNKPTAFALHGIQFEGNVTEQHMVALRGIINAAAEGRLLLPSNGAFVLLDSENGEPTMQVSNTQQTLRIDRTKTVLPASALHQEIDDQLCELIEAAASPDMDACDGLNVNRRSNSAINAEPKYSEFELPELSKYDFIYEFLCCAKCINKLDRKGHSSACTNNIHRLAHRYARDDRPKYRRCDRDSNEEMAEYRLNRMKKSNQAVMPIYATVNQKQHKKLELSDIESMAGADKHLPNDSNTEETNAKNSDCIRNEDNENRPTVMSKVPRIEETVQQSNAHENDLQIDTIDLSAVQLRLNSSKSSSRKTSLDSSCTIGSMDSGFIEMQNKLEANNAKELNATDSSATTIPQITVADVDDDANVAPTSPAHPLKECSTQSRNRRKSYEEFKAIYHNRMTLESELPFVQEHDPSTLTTCSQTEKIKARRKSYEEFKALVSAHNDQPSMVDPMPKNASQQANEMVSDIENNGTIALEKQESQHASAEMNKCDALAATSPRSSAITVNQSKTKNDIYKTNYKIYDKLISYGTIYDIMQKKSDIYKAYSKYDTYMTYGTIYEILQRKSDDYEVFRRKRVASEKCINKRVSLDSSECIDSIGRATKDDRSRSITFGAIYEIIQRKQRQKKSNSLPNGMCAAIELTAPFDSVTKTNHSDRHHDGCIYDIIQTEQCDTAKLISNEAKRNTQSVIKNRFLVEKVNEKELIPLQSNDGDKSLATVPSNGIRAHTYSEPTVETQSPSFLAKWNGQKVKKLKKPNRVRRFSQILLYSQHRSQTDRQATTISGNDNSGDGGNRIPQINNECTDKGDESVASAVATATDAIGSETNTAKAETSPFESNKLSKLRKLSAPLPITAQFSQPPKIVPRKMSAPPPPPLPPSINVVGISMPLKRNDDSGQQLNANKSNKLKVDSNGFVDSGNGGKNRIDNKSAATEQNISTESDSIRPKCVNNACDNRGAKFNGKVTNKTGDVAATKATVRKACLPDGKTKSRRLSEFTRGEFLNEKP